MEHDEKYLFKQLIELFCPLGDSGTRLIEAFSGVFYMFVELNDKNETDCRRNEK